MKNVHSLDLMLMDDLYISIVATCGSIGINLVEFFIEAHDEAMITLCTYIYSRLVCSMDLYGSTSNNPLLSRILS